MPKSLMTGSGIGWDGSRSRRDSRRALPRWRKAAASSRDFTGRASSRKKSGRAGQRSLWWRCRAGRSLRGRGKILPL